MWIGSLLLVLWWIICNFGATLIGTLPMCQIVLFTTVFNNNKYLPNKKKKKNVNRGHQEAIVLILY